MSQMISVLNITKIKSHLNLFGQRRGGSLFGDELLTYAVSLPRLRTAAAMLGRYDVETCEPYPL